MANQSHFQLHVITDGQRKVEELQTIVGKAVRGGADVIQLRYKSAPALDLYTLGKAILPLIREAGSGLLINDRVDVALALDAQGVHLAAKSLPIPAVRPLLQTDKLIGCSVHSVEEAVAAEAMGASYITYGHIYATNSKPGLPPRGVDNLRQVVDAVNIPVLAIGGITKSNIDEVLSTGIAGIAVIGAVMADADPQEAAHELRAKMDASSHTPKHALPVLK
ncbi:MAG: thiamine phosphate synthase [Tumebacillaceae bacterium]